MFKKISIALIVILAVILCVLFVTARRNNNSDNSVETFNSKINVLVNQKSLLQTEYNKLDSQYHENIYGRGTVNLIFTDFDNLILTNVFPLFNQYGLCGQLMLNQNQYPGAEGCMTVEQFEELMTCGWEYILWYDGSVEFNIWLIQMNTLLEKLQLSKSFSSIIFDEGTYNSAYDELALNNGYNILLHHGEEGDDIITQGVGDERGLWKVGTITAFYSKHTSRINEANDCGGNIAMTLGTRSAKEIFTDEMIQSLANQLYNLVLDGKSYQMSTTNAYKYKNDIYSENQKYIDDLAVKKAEIQKNIDDVDASINEIKDEFFNKYHTEVSEVTSETTTEETTAQVELPEND